MKSDKKLYVVPKHRTDEISKFKAETYKSIRASKK